jgi:hypothetical protein
MRALQNCARCTPKASRPFASRQRKCRLRRRLNSDVAAARVRLCAPVAGSSVPSATSMTGEHVNAKGKVKFFNETKGWILEAGIKWAVTATLSHFQ